MAEAITSPDLHKILKSDYPKEKITKVDLDLSGIEYGNKVAYLLEDVFSEEECQVLIDHTEGLGYSQALVHCGDKAVLAPGYRDSERLMIDDKEFVKILFGRFGHLLPQTFQFQNDSKVQKLVEINERLRFLKYKRGDAFKPHSDSSYERPDSSAVTEITLQIYLNEGMAGGETTFLRYSAEDLLKPENRVPVTPKPGRVLVFEHCIYHEGSRVRDGLKYTIRCDVLYTYGNDAGGN